MKKKGFYRMLLTYLPVFIVVLSFLCFAFFQVLSFHSQRQAVTMSETLARQAIRAVEFSLKSIDERLTRELLTNEEYRLFFEENDPNHVYTDIRSVKLMQDLTVSYPLIDSIYFVRYRDGHVLSNRTSSPLGTYPDRAFLGDELPIKDRQWSDVRTFQEFPAKPGREVVSLVRGFPFSRGTHGLVVINVNVERLRLQIKELYHEEVSFVNLYDRNGANLMHSADGSALRERPALQKERMATYVSGYAGWTVESGMMLQPVIGLLLEFNQAWTYIGVVIVLLGLISLVFITWKHYEPIDHIVSNIKRYAAERTSHMFGSQHRNEFDFIGAALDHLIEQSNRNQTQFEEDIGLRKKYWFREVLAGERAVGAEQWREMMSKLGQPEEFRQGIVFMLEIDHYADFQSKYDDRDQFLLKFILSSVAQEVAGKSEAWAWPEWTERNRLTGIVHFPSEADLTHQAVFALFESYREWVAKHLKFTVTIGAGGIASEVGGLARSYRQSIEALHYKAVIGSNRFISVEETEGAEYERQPHIEHIHSLVDKLRMGDDEATERLRTLFEQMRTTMMRREDIVNLANYLAYQIDRVMMEISPELYQGWRQEGAAGWSAALESFDTIDELEQYVSLTIAILLERMKEQRSKKASHELMLNVREYIERHATEPDMSLQRLSEEFGLNSKYVSKLFKEALGMNFIDFLVELRMRRAKTLLLEEPGMSVKEIGERVGYANMNSFNRAFRQSVGVPPGEFRNRQRYEVGKNATR
ncbi:helix-turn-helix domain-containing protein [Paenibacillus sp.]|uniref:helix-turn-helix domain-containing protein n=1 Tax=Paenibacillus sp. TaxID=58172 RepID=UPI0028125004|nr:helix-turn-helix domain-containing protein [Paenibacillus sp.]